MEIITKSNRKFIHIGYKPHIKKDGTSTELMVWQSSCIDCGENFTVTTPKSTTKENDSNSFYQCRCSNHVKKPHKIQSDFLMNVIFKRK